MMVVSLSRAAHWNLRVRLMALHRSDNPRPTGNLAPPLNRDGVRSKSVSAKHPRPGKRAPLTHFLCLPLVNDISLPQLESSITAFKAAYPPVSITDLPNSRDPRVKQDISRPLIPDGAIRPLGTLHLTLGVMSLPTKERLSEALTFFRTLDLRTLMLESERVAADLRAKQSSSKHLRIEHHAGHRPAVACPSTTIRPETFMVSLESLHALPRAKAATVLHASPVDRTDRLYPFCVMLRDKFIEAGFIVGEGEKQSNTEAIRNEAAQSTSTGQIVQSSSSCPDLAAEENLPRKPGHNGSQDHSVELPVPPKLDLSRAALARTPKPRPLLLHATLVNTIYVRGRPKPRGDGAKQKGGNKRIEFDARGLLARYRNYYIDETRTRARAVSGSIQREDTQGSTDREFPFVWAHGIPIDSICICEMGAKKIDLDDAAMADPASALLNARLGEKYTVVAERAICPNN